MDVARGRKRTHACVTMRWQCMLGQQQVMLHGNYGSGEQGQPPPSHDVRI